MLQNLHIPTKTSTFAHVKNDNRVCTIVYGISFFFGEMAEWSIAAVLKTVEGHTSGGSNPSLSAKLPDRKSNKLTKLQINDL